MKFIDTVADNKDFYPTPAAVVKKMMEGIDICKCKNILEPSAGAGDIVFQLLEAGIYDFEDYKGRNLTVYEDGYNIDCCESDERLRAVLESRISKPFQHKERMEWLWNNRQTDEEWREYKDLEEREAWHSTIKRRVAIVHDDFLTFRPYKNYQLVVMNPPFSEGDKHLLKAIEIQKNGGKIVCLLNAETIKNPYANTRKELCKKLEEYGASVEFVENAFLDAERKTGVEIAIVKIDIPEAENNFSYFFDKMEKAANHKEAVGHEETGVVTADYIKGMVQRYQNECRTGIQILKELEALKKVSLTIPAKPKTEKEFLEEVRKAYWKELLKNNAFSGKLTADNAEKLERQIEEISQFEFCESNIKTVAVSLNATVFDGIKKALPAMFDKLTAEHSLSNGENIHYYNGWATNQAHKIGKKSVLWYGSVDLYSAFNSRKALKYLRDIELCFQYLDGNVDDGSELKNVLSELKENYDKTGDTKYTKNVKFRYFTATFYKKGTCHITYTRTDLVDKFNIYIGKSRNWLPDDYGKKSYSSMTAEEKGVVDSFHADMKSSYSEICKKSDFFLEEVGKSLIGIEEKKQPETAGSNRKQPEAQSDSTAKKPENAYNIIDNFVKSNGKVCAFVASALNDIYNYSTSDFKNAFETVNAIKKIKAGSALAAKYAAL